MSFWKKVKQTAIVDRLVEEKLYAQVLREIESGLRRDGLWAKAFQKSHGNEQKAKALYYEYRIQSIKDEAEIAAMYGEQLDKTSESIIEPSKDGYQGEGCIKCGGNNFEYDEYNAEYICTDCGFSTNKKQLIADRDVDGTEKKNKTLADYSARRYKQMNNDFSEKLGRIEKRFSNNLEKLK